MKLADKIEIITRSYISDNRGFFVKIINGKEKGLPNYTGEIYVTLAKPENSRGGHYHNLATEWFTVVSGNADLHLKDIMSDEEIVIKLESENPVTIKVPPGIVHEFYNNYNKDFILIAYTDFLFDPKDTIPYSLMK